VLVPRLTALGADLALVHELYMDPADGLVSLPGDLAELERVAAETEARLLVIDPVAAALDLRLDSHKDRDVRVVVAGLASFAERRALASLGITHLNKTVSADVYARTSGSIATYNASRALWTLTADPDAPDTLRLLVQHKANYTALAPPERWRVKPVTLDGGIETAILEFVEIAADVRREDVLAVGIVEKRGEAETLLVAELTLGPRPSADVKAAGARRGISSATIKRAAQELGVEVEQRVTSTGRNDVLVAAGGVGSALHPHI
jgi:AAA domain